MTNIYTRYIDSEMWSIKYCEELESVGFGKADLRGFVGRYAKYQVSGPDNLNFDQEWMLGSSLEDMQRKGLLDASGLAK